MKIHQVITLLPLLLLFGSCSDEVEPDSDATDKVGLHLFSGWTAEIPISPGVRSISFENWRGGDWERIYTLEIQQGIRPSSLPVYIIPGVDLDREVVYAIDGFRGAYRIPDGVNGKLVWKGVEKVSDRYFNVLSLETEQGSVPCVRIKTLTKSEQAADGDAVESP